MKDKNKTKKQLIEELAELHQTAAELNVVQTKRKQADKLLRKSEERLRTQYQNIPIPTYTWQRAGEDFILVDYNKAGATMTSGAISDLKGVKANELYNDQPEIIADFSHCFDKRTVLKKEMSYRLKTTGEDKHLAVSYAFVPPDLVQVHTEDITSRKQAEIELRESEERFRRLVETMRDGLGVQDENGLITYVNERACELSGFSRDELIGRPAVDLIDEPFQKMFAEEFSRRREGKSSSYEITWRRKDGSKLPAIMASTPVFDSEGKFRGSFGIITDITQRKRAEEALRESEERYRGIVETQAELICRFLPDGTLTFVNDTICRFLGERSEELIGKSFYPYIHPDDRQKTRKNLESLSKENPIGTNEERVIMPDGEIHWWQWSNQALFDEKDSKMELQSVGRDITKRKKAEDALRKSEAELAAQSRHLEEVNAALRVLLKQREEDKEDLEGRLLANVKELVLPYVDKLKNSRLDSDQMTLAAILESNIKAVSYTHLRAHET